MKIAICQINSTVGDLEGNANKVLNYYHRARNEKADLAIFPELVITGYPPLDLLERKDLVEKELKIINEMIQPNVIDCGLLIGAVTVNNGSGKLFHNSAILIDNGKIKSIIHKQLLPTYDLFDERRYYQEGKPSTPLLYKGVMLGITICEDMWKRQNEKSLRLYTIDPIDNLGEQGVDLFINISASPFVTDKDKIRRRIMEDYCSKWQKPFIMVNAVGANDSIIFDGKSKFISKKSILAYQACGFKEDFSIIDTEQKEIAQSIEHNKQKDIFDALVLGLKDYLFKNNLKGFVIGLSGGIDSAVCAVLATSAAGCEHVYGITMPSMYSSEGSYKDSEKLADNLGINFKKISISEHFNSLIMAGQKELNIEFSGMSAENMQSRLRGLILMSVSNQLGSYVVLATGNKSEIATGYCTLYGDTCGALAPIGDLFKIDVYKLAEYMNIEREIIPIETIKKQPSAELRPGQLDTDSLPPYAELDRILGLYVENDFSPENIIEQTSFSKEKIDHVINLVTRTEFKRKQLPPVLKISQRAFGVDRRWPVVHRFK